MDNAAGEVASSQTNSLPTRSTSSSSSSSTLDNLTKGQAANIITRLQHGAKAHYDRKQKERKRAYNVAVRTAERVERETVRVGPLKC